MTKRLAHYSVSGMESPIREMPGESVYAIRAPHMHTNKLRPEQFRDKEWGFVIHTTGSGLPEKARRLGVNPTVIAADMYFKSRGPHYVCGWGGYEAGDLLQVANERIQSNGVGTTEKRNKKTGKLEKKGQRQSEQGKYGGHWTKDLPASLVKRWKAAHPGYDSPLGLLPKGARKSVTSCCIQMEMPPCIFWVGKKKVVGAEPMRPGLKFTEAQHDTAAFLAVDIAHRKKWPDGWWLTPRLGGHEDFTPISRSNSGGGWDPGGLRAKPFFDWEYVRNVIIDIAG